MTVHMLSLQVGTQSLMTLAPLDEDGKSVELDTAPVVTSDNPAVSVEPHATVALAFWVVGHSAGFARVTITAASQGTDVSEAVDVTVSSVAPLVKPAVTLGITFDAPVPIPQPADSSAISGSEVSAQ